MQIEMSDEAANFLQSKASEAGFASVEAYLLSLIREPEMVRADPQALPYDEWRERFRAFLARQTSRNPHFDDTRETIYLGP